MNPTELIQASWQFATASHIRFGRGSRRHISTELNRSGLTRPLVVTDHNLIQVPGVVSLLEMWQRQFSQVTLFDGCVAEPPIETACAAAEAGRDSDCDCVVGIGGGSNLDVAKMAATLIRHGGEPRDYFGFDRIRGPILPMVAVPTTAGTGSEVSHSSVLTDRAAEVKVSTLSRWLRPTWAIVDPELTDTCPPVVTAHSGIDALVHAIEAVTNRSFSEMGDVDPQARAYEGSYPLTRLLAAEAIRLIGSHLRRACANADDHAARDAMALAAMYAGMAFSNSGVALVHALEYPIGAAIHCSHGEGNGLLLPHVMLFNLPACTSTMADIARWMVQDASDQTADGGSHDATHGAELAVSVVKQLLVDIGIRTRLRDLGLDRARIAEMAGRAFQIKRLMDVNPRRPSEADLVTILESAW